MKCNFFMKKWNDRLYQVIRLIAVKWSSMQWRSERTPANINKVEDLALSQKDKPQKQFKMENYVAD